MNSFRAINATLVPLLTAFVSHCSSTPSNSPAEISEGMSQTDNPDLIPGLGGQAVRTLTDLPESGQIRTKVWRGYWWPLRRGGMLQRTAQNGPSPIEKYDQALGLGNKAVAWEKDFNVKFGNVHWAGFCNGLAAAAMMTKEPVRSVNYRNITFAPSDIKALLVRIWNTSGRTVGGRCNSEHELVGESGRETTRSCRDINPATLHLSLTNFIGRFGIPIILDQSAYAEIWNFPVVSYSSKSVEISRISASQAVDASDEQGYRWNPYAAKFYRTETRVVYQTLTANDVGVTYRYVIETDSHGQILGGEWIGDSKLKHPDFVWRPGLPDTSESTFNPFLSAEVIDAIYQQSI